MHPGAQCRALCRLEPRANRRVRLGLRGRTAALPAVRQVRQGRVRRVPARDGERVQKGADHRRQGPAARGPGGPEWDTEAGRCRVCVPAMRIPGSECYGGVLGTARDKLLDAPPHHRNKTASGRHRMLPAQGIRPGSRKVPALTRPESAHGPSGRGLHSPPPPSFPSLPSPPPSRALPQPALPSVLPAVVQGATERCVTWFCGCRLRNCTTRLGHLHSGKFPAAGTRIFYPRYGSFASQCKFPCNWTGHACFSGQKDVLTPRT